MTERVKKKARATNVSRTAPSRYVMEDQVGFLMRVAMQRHTSVFMSLMVHDLTQTQFAALAKLVEVGTCSQNQLGRLIYLDANTVKGVVDRLRTRKLVTIESTPKDRRRSMVAVTKVGYRVAVEATALAHQITKATLASLRPLEQRQLLRKNDLIALRTCRRVWRRASQVHRSPATSSWTMCKWIRRRCRSTSNGRATLSERTAVSISASRA